MSIEVEAFIALGPLPSVADEGVINAFQLRLQKIRKPVTDEEAALLVTAFGPDDCYGLAWSLLHLVESAPGGIPLKSRPSSTDSEWLLLLWERAHRQEFR